MQIEISEYTHGLLQDARKDLQDNHKYKNISDDMLLGLLVANHYAFLGLSIQIGDFYKQAITDRDATQEAYRVG
jgi:hypothetical protein